MSVVISQEQARGGALAEGGVSPPRGGAWPGRPTQGAERVAPNALVRWAFYASAFSIPFMCVYLPGTGERVGVLRLVQVLLLAAVVSQPRVCLRLAPLALIWFVVYCGVRIISGLWLSPELSGLWWPSTLDWLQFSLPWVWIIFNVLQFPRVRRPGLWSYVWGCSLCALLHVLGVGVSAVDNEMEEVRTTVFGENANVVGATYAVGVIVLIGLGMFKNLKSARRLLLVPLIALVGFGAAKTGSRTALLLIGMGVVVLLFQAESFSARAKRYASLVLVGAVLAGIVWQVPTVWARFNDLDPHNLGQDNPRARMAPVLWEIFLRSPIYGSGPDQYQFELTRRAMPYLIRDQRTIAAHNLALLLLAETGAIGFLIFSAGLWEALAAAWKARLTYCGYLPLALLVPFLVAAFVLSNPAPHHVFWFVIAYALAGAA
ncbi:MAG TPA: O-antigen ligase family protein [Verrucomicrobiae bacterium]|nr:O-antigen ligase family protein [Verrucomicrobiae bacterium]